MAAIMNIIEERNLDWKIKRWPEILLAIETSTREGGGDKQGKESSQVGKKTLIEKKNISNRFSSPPFSLSVPSLILGN